MEKELKKEELEVPEDLKETPREREFNGRIIFVFSLILTVLIIGALAYISKAKSANYKQTASASPTPTSAPANETASWRTYEGNGFTFKYPSEWVVSAPDVNGDTGITLPKEKSDCPNCAGGSIGVSVSTYSKPDSLSLYDFLSDPKHMLGYSGPYKKDFSKLDLPNFSDALFNPTALGAGEVQEEAIINGGKFVASLYCQSSLCTQKNLFKNVLSTLQFTNNYVSDTSNWKTYTNINGGDYSIEYPPTWHYAAGGDINQGNESIAFGPNVTTSNEAENNPLRIKMQKPNQSTGITDPKSYADSIKGPFGIVHDGYTFNGMDNAYQVLSDEPYLSVIIFQRNNIIYSIWYGQNLSTDDHKNINTSLNTLTFTK